MSPILVRPVREQLEHDRVIRLLQAKYKRKFDVAINPGNEQGTAVGTDPSLWYPDLVLFTPDRNRKLVGVVEVETVESINHLEAMSQWAAFARLKTPFHLYVPAAMVDVARRFCSDLQIAVTEVWAYHTLGDQIRFTPVQRAAGAEDGGTVKEARRPRAAAAPVAKPAKVAAVKKPPVAKVAPVKPAPPPKSSAVSKSTASSKGAKSTATRSAAAKVVRRPAPPVRKKVTRPVQPVKAARPPAKKAVARASRRK